MIVFLNYFQNCFYVIQMQILAFIKKALIKIQYSVLVQQLFYFEYIRNYKVADLIFYFLQYLNTSGYAPSI